MAFLTDFPKEKKIMNKKNIVPRRNLILYKTLEYLEDRETKQKKLFTSLLFHTKTTIPEVVGTSTVILL